MGEQEKQEIRKHLNKLFLNDYLNNNYENIISIASNIYKNKNKIDYTFRLEGDHHDLLQTICHAIEKREKLRKIINDLLDIQLLNMQKRELIELKKKIEKLLKD